MAQDYAKAEELARIFHDTYERLAPDYGYETREDTKQFEKESKNGQLMIATVAHLLEYMHGNSGGYSPPVSTDAIQTAEGFVGGEKLSLDAVAVSTDDECTNPSHGNDMSIKPPETFARCGVCGKRRRGFYDGGVSTDEPCACKTWASMDVEWLRTGIGHHPDCNGRGGHRDDLLTAPAEPSAEKFNIFVDATARPKPEPSLQLLSLLVIDLSDCCVVKVESNTTEHWMCPIVGQVESIAMREGETRVMRTPFAQVRSALDALADGDKPVPRLVNEKACYRLWDVEGLDTELYQRQVSALSQLAGVTIPVFESKTGEWTQLFPLETWPDVGLLVLPFKAWRFTN